MTLKILYELLHELMRKDIDFYPIYSVVQDMHEAGDGNTSFSCDNIGVNITENAINIYDIFAGKTIATLELKLKED